MFNVLFALRIPVGADENTIQKVLAELDEPLPREDPSEPTEEDLAADAAFFAQNLRQRQQSG